MCERVSVQRQILLLIKVLEPLGVEYCYLTRFLCITLFGELFLSRKIWIYVLIIDIQKGYVCQIWLNCKSLGSVCCLSLAWPKLRFGTWLYQFLIFAPLLTLIIRSVLSVLHGGPKSLPALSFNAIIIPILRIMCTISSHYSFPWISSMFLTTFKITRWPIIDEMVGVWCFGCSSGLPGFTSWTYFAQVFSFIYWWVIIYA